MIRSGTLSLFQYIKLRLICKALMKNIWQVVMFNGRFPETVLEWTRSVLWLSFPWKIKKVEEEVDCKQAEVVFLEETGETRVFKLSY